MKKIRDSSENEMVSEFLKAEIESPRFKKYILPYLEKRQINPSIIEKPNLSNQEENEIRKAVLGSYRGYKKDTRLFHWFPENIRWELISLNKQDIQKLTCIDYDYWVKLSGGTRLFSEITKNIALGIEINGQGNKLFWNVAEKYKNKEDIPKPILVSTNPKDEKIIVLEGHLRLAAYLLAGNDAPKELEAIIGYSENISNWGLY